MNRFTRKKFLNPSALDQVDPPSPKRSCRWICAMPRYVRRKRVRVVQVVNTIVFGTMALLLNLLGISMASKTINTSFVERNNGTNRTQNARKVRKTYRFSKDWVLHNASFFFIGFSYNFCWPVRTLRQKDIEGHWHKPDTGNGSRPH